LIEFISKAGAVGLGLGVGVGVGSTALFEQDPSPNMVNIRSIKKYFFVEKSISLQIEIPY
jgi:hypothetical protein